MASDAPVARQIRKPETRRGFPAVLASPARFERASRGTHYTIDDVAAIFHLGRTSAYALVKEGHFKIIRIGNAIRISKKSFDEWLDSLNL